MLDLRPLKWYARIKTTIDHSVFRRLLFRGWSGHCGYSEQCSQVPAAHVPIQRKPSHSPSEKAARVGSVSHGKSGRGHAQRNCSVVVRTSPSLSVCPGSIARSGTGTATDHRPGSLAMGSDWPCADGRSPDSNSSGVRAAGSVIRIVPSESTVTVTRAACRGPNQSETVSAGKEGL